MAAGRRVMPGHEMGWVDPMCADADDSDGEKQSEDVHDAVSCHRCDRSGAHM